MGIDAALRRWQRVADEYHWELATLIVWYNKHSRKLEDSVGLKREPQNPVGVTIHLVESPDDRGDDE